MLSIINLDDDETLSRNRAGQEGVISIVHAAKSRAKCYHLPRLTGIKSTDEAH